MKPLRRGRRRQQGVALILIVTVIILGVAWFSVGALGKAAPTDVDREIRTGAALRAAKQALLGYAAHYAARTAGVGSTEPGQMPCPELVTLANPGEAAAACSNVAPSIGRLPWQTLGIDQLRDGYGEPLWYVLSPGFRASPINFGTPAQLTYNGAPNAAVALIIAPGRPLSIGGCNATQQHLANRNQPNLVPANFIECGNAAGNYASGATAWNNDRVIAITAAEWADAIAPAIADRLQRQVAPAINEWRAQSLASWGRSYLPYASTFGTPAFNDLCGNTNVTEGLPPLALASTGCATSWTGANVTQILGLGTLLFAPFCFDTGPTMQCWIFYDGLLALRITATAPGIANGFRSPIGIADIVASSGVKSNFSISLAANGTATVRVDVQPPLIIGFGIVIVDIPHLPDAALLGDARLTWFLLNGWERHVYYAVARGAVANPPAACVAAGDAGCMVLAGLPAANGVTNDKRLVLALMGRAVAGQAQPSNNANQYLESGNASLGDQAFLMGSATQAFNDRLAACPFQVSPAAGPLALCN